MKRTRRTLLSLALCLVLLAGLLPLSASAEDNVRTEGIEILADTPSQTFPIGKNTNGAKWDADTKTLTFSGTGTIISSIKKQSAVDITVKDDINPTIVLETGADITLKTIEQAGNTILATKFSQSKADTLTVKVQKNARLQIENATTASGGHGILSVYGLAIQVEKGGVLTTVGSFGLSGTDVTVDNKGTFVASGKSGIYASGNVSIEGGGTSLVYGGYSGIHSAGSSIEIGKDDPAAEDVRGVIAGGERVVSFQSSTPDPGFQNHSPATCLTMNKASDELLETLRNVDTADYSSGLDLTKAEASACYANVGGGMALWEYKTGKYADPHRLTLMGVHLTGNLSLPGGFVEIDFMDTNNIAGVVMPVVSQEAKSLTLGALAATGPIPGDNTGKVDIGPGGFTNIDGVSFHTPANGYYATAYANGPSGGSHTVPGSVFRDEDNGGGGGYYIPSAEDKGLTLEYAAIADLAGQSLLTVEEGSVNGTGVLSTGASSTITFAGQDTDDFFGWELFDPLTHESLGTAGLESPKERTTKFTMPNEHVWVRAILEQDGPAPTPGPSLEKGEHGAYINGYGDGTIRPEANLTREETAQLFYNLMDEASRTRYESAENPFTDVSEKRWSYKAICTLANAGILKGDPDGKFRPTGTVTRAEFAAIAARFDPGAYTGDDLFPDIEKHWARNDINYAADKGWVQGYQDGTFRPNEKITRAEAATLINRVLERAPETIEDLLPGRRVFTDNGNEKAWYYLALEEAANSHDYRRKSYSGLEETWTALQ